MKKNYYSHQNIKIIINDEYFAEARGLRRSEMTNLTIHVQKPTLQ